MSFSSASTLDSYYLRSPYYYINQRLLMIREQQSFRIKDLIKRITREMCLDGRREEHQQTFAFASKLTSELNAITLQAINQQIKKFVKEEQAQNTPVNALRSSSIMQDSSAQTIDRPRYQPSQQQNREQEQRRMSPRPFNRYGMNAIAGEESLVNEFSFVQERKGGRQPGKIAKTPQKPKIKNDVYLKDYPQRTPNKYSILGPKFYMK